MLYTYVSVKKNSLIQLLKKHQNTFNYIFNIMLFLKEKNWKAWLTYNILVHVLR